MKNKNQCWVFAFFLAVYLCSCAQSYAQIDEKFAFGIKAGVNHLNTRLVQQPRDLKGQIGGVYDANGFQMSVWSTAPLSRRFFIDTDLGFIQKGHDLRFNNALVASNRYRYFNFSPRLGATYEGIFVSIGPEVNVLVAKDVRPWKEANPVEWNLNVRFGYQYRRWRADAFFSRSFTTYEERSWDADKQYKNLFYGNTIGFSVGVRLFGGKAKKQ